jgi:hypothetical protein
MHERQRKRWLERLEQLMGKRRSFIEVGGERIPVLDDVATLLYLADDDEEWPAKPFNFIRSDLPWLLEGMVVALRNLDPSGDMGKALSVQVVQVRVEVQMHAGKYGQVIRRVLLSEVLPDEEIRQMYSGRKP